MNDVGEAFVTSSPLPLKKWVHVVLTVNGYEVSLSTHFLDEGILQDRESPNTMLLKVFEISSLY